MPEVIVAEPVIREITDYEDFSGRTEAINSIEVRARVTGYLDKVRFTEGMEVKKGDPLFEIDPRAYRAEVNRTEASVAQNDSRLKRLEMDRKRAAELISTRAISQEDFDRITGDYNEAAAAVKVAEAAGELARLNLNFCVVTAPISGKISRQLIDPGNLVRADDTLLTTIIAHDPIYAYFDVDERTMLKMRRKIRSGQIKSIREASVPVFLGLVDEEGFPHEGKIDFVDNRVDAMTGTLRLRAVFRNPNRLLTPGLFVRVRQPIGGPHSAILVSEKAVGTDQGQKFVFVVNDKDEVVHRPLKKVGPLHDGLRVVEEGIEPGERIVVKGLQRVRPGIKVTYKTVSMTNTESWSDEKDEKKEKKEKKEEPPRAASSEAKKPDAPSGTTQATDAKQDARKESKQESKVEPKAESKS